MQNGTITYYLPYNILSSSNLVVNVCIVEYKFNPPVADMLVPAPSTPECIPLPI